MEPAPLYNEITGSTVKGLAHWLTTSDGVRIRVAHWPCAPAKGTILLFPGRTEFVEKYGRTATSLIKRGYSSVAVDWRGQGLADRLHPNPAIGHVDDYKHYQKDVAAVMAHVAALDLPKPYFVIGHSMGGAIALRAIIEGLAVKACGFSAPFWGVQTTSPLLVYAWTVTTLARIFGFTQRIVPGQFEETYVLRAPFEGNSLTTDPEAFETMQNMVRAQPELALGGPSLAWLSTALRETRELAAMPSPDIDCLSYISTGEAIVDIGRIKRRMAAWPRGKLHVLQGAQHEMLMDRPEYRDTLITGFTTLFDANLD